MRFRTKHKEEYGKTKPQAAANSYGRHPHARKTKNSMTTQQQTQSDRKRPGEPQHTTKYVSGQQQERTRNYGTAHDKDNAPALAELVAEAAVVVTVVVVVDCVVVVVEEEVSGPSEDLPNGANGPSLLHHTKGTQTSTATIPGTKL